MLSYLHGFHAGNFADVHKHLIYCLVLDYLLKKDKPLAVIDVYAGAGFYDYPEGGGKKLWKGLKDAFPVKAEQPTLAEVKARIREVVEIPFPYPRH